MKFAAVASDLEILQLLEAVQMLEGNSVSAFWAETQELQEVISQTCPAAQRCDSWDQILEQSVDAVIVAGVDESILTAAKQFAAAGVPLLVGMVTNGEPAKVFEFTSIWQDAPQRVFPLFFSGMEAISKHEIDRFAAEKHGQLWQVDFTRMIQSRSDGSPFSKSVALSWFLQDCAWMRDLDQRATFVRMEVSGPSDATPTEYRVRLSGEDSLEINWRLRIAAESHWQLKLSGEKGDATCNASANGDVLPDDATITEPQSDSILKRESSRAGQRTSAVVIDLAEQLQAFIQGKPRRNWSDVIQLGEFGATASRSLLKRRTLPVHFEEASERSQFKSQMAAVGCGALLWTMFAMIGLLTIGAIADPRDREYLTSSSAGYVLRTHEFEHGEKSELTERGKEHLLTIAKNWSSVSPVLIIEEVEGLPSDDSEALNLVASHLRELGIRSPEKKIVVRPIDGDWFETAMLIGWVFVFLPLGLVLLAQALIVVSRPVD